MAKSHNYHKPGDSPPVGTPLSADVIEHGDLLYLSGGAKPRPASAFPISGDAAYNELSFAQHFLGVSAQASAAGDTKDLTFHSHGEFEFDCASQTFQLGQMVAPLQTAGALVDQSVQKTSNPGKAIGKVVQAYTNATTRVVVRINSRLLGDELSVPTSSSGL